MSVNVQAELDATVWKVEVDTGATVAEGDVIAILESMKMEIPVEATASGVVRVLVAEGDSVQDEQVIAVIEPQE